MKKVIKFLGKNVVYEGNLRNDKLNGYGILKDLKKTFYEGNFKDGKMNGKGIYSSPQILRNLIYNFPYLQTFNSPDEFRVVGNFKNNKLHGDDIQIFTEEGDFFYGSFNNGNIKKKGFMGGGGWLVEMNGHNMARLMWSGSSKSFEYFEEKEFTWIFSKFIESYEYQFSKYQWFPNKLCENETDFKKTLKHWKKNSKKIIKFAHSHFYEYASSNGQVW